MLGENDVISTGIDTFIQKYILPIFEAIISFVFSSQWITIIVALLAMNLIAIVLMKRDKEYAKMEKRRTRETTLLMVAAFGGAMGMYYAMYKYKHKTLHKKFTILVPVFMAVHFAYLTYMLMSTFVV